MKRQIIKALAATAVIGAGCTGAGSSATASTAAPRHCAVQLESGQTTCAADQREASRQLGATASYLVVQVWKAPNYTGDSLTYWKSGKCTATMTDRERSQPVLPSGWNDQLSSVKTDLTAVTKCSLRIFRDGRFNGPSFTIDYRNPNLGANGWNNLASSWYVS